MTGDRECSLFDPRTQIVGFRITVEGDDIPSSSDGILSELRVQFREEGRAESTYIVVDGPGTADYLFEDARVQYAVDRGDTSVPGINPDLVYALQFQITTIPEADTPFSFCVSKVEPILG